MSVPRIVIRWTTPGVCALVLYAALLAGFHHHRPAADPGACMACAAGQSRALPAAETVICAEAPVDGEAPSEWYRAAPAPAALRAAPPRAPPLG